MNLDGVDVFVKVVQAGGFSAAARQMDMPTTTVSAKIARLESRLGVTLIQRSTRRLHVTAAGDAYFQRCVAAMELLEAGESELAASQTTPTGLIRLTAAPDTAQTLLPPIVAAYLERYPLTRIDIVATNQVLDLIGEGIDLGVRAAMRLKDSTLHTRKFTQGRLILVASRAFLDRHGRPTRVADLRMEHMLIHSRFPRDIAFRDADGAIHQLNPAGRLQIDDMQSLRALARAGVGIALVPAVANALDGLEQVLPGTGTPPAPMQFVFPAARHMSAAVRAFIDLAVDMDARGEIGL